VITPATGATLVRPRSAAALPSARSMTENVLVVWPELSVSLIWSPEIEARTEMSRDVLIFLMTSSTVTADEMSMTPDAPEPSVMRKRPRRTPLPPLSWASRVWVETSPPPCSIVSVPAPTLASSPV
jgi:hypothetical protein